MFVITSSKSEKEVGKALEALVNEVNLDLEKAVGRISDMDCEVSVGPLDASVSISIFLDGDEPVHKFLIGVNEKGYSRSNSLKKAEKMVNNFLDDVGGSIASSYVRTISSLPGRVYTTLILAVNGNVVDEVKQIDTNTRRMRIKKGLGMLGNDASILNVARLARIFGVSRTMIYKDLEVLGYKR